MADKLSENHSILCELAEQDEIYNLWKTCYQDSAEAFALFANSQPDAIKNTLWAYAESGRLMYQRICTLACQHMHFTESQ